MEPTDVLPSRFWEKVDIGDCWEWLAGRRRGGYASYWHEGSGKLGHRVAYEALVGAIPDHLEIDHLCRNRSCVNPEHLDLVTRRENTLRGESFAAQNARKVKCHRGHRDWRPQPGGRVCATCVKEANVRFRERQKKS